MRENGKSWSAIGPAGAAPSLQDLNARERSGLIAAVDAGVTRRQAIRLLCAAGIGAAAAGTLFDAAGQVLAATPKRGGRVRCAMTTQGPNDTLDPQLFTSSIDFVRGRAHYNGLVQLDDSLVPQPELAEKFSANSDATEWTFTLRRGVEFHDGSPLTADDVVWSLNRHLGEDSKSKVKVLVSTVKAWRKVDSHTVTAELTAPNADLPAILGTHHFRILKAGTTDFQNPAGTGPFRLERFEPGRGSTHLRNEAYWRDGPHLDEIELFAISDTTARVSALLAGDVEMISNLDPNSLLAVEGEDAVKVWSVPSGSYPCIVCMTDRAPGNDRDFVLALKYLQRRDQLVQSILKGQGTVGNDQPINQSYPDFCPEVAQRPFDPEKAKFHLGKSGITRAAIQVAEISNGVTDMVLVMQREAAKIGLQLDVQRVPNDGYWSNVWMKTPLHVGDWNMRPTANVMMNIAFAPDAAWNESQWKSERMGELLASARATTEPEQRRALHCEMQQLVSDESGVIIPVHKNAIDGLAGRVQGMTRNPLGTLGGAEWPEFVWLDS